MTLTRTCPDCSGNRIVCRPGQHPNDPFARPMQCETCEGEGTLTRFCEGWRCSAPATELIDSEPFCDEHAREWRADQESATDAGPVSGETA